jgi:RimJ/RimL family protein N-acetyltransferase
MDQPTLQTARLRLRPYSLSDAADLVRLAGAPEVAATTLRIPHPYYEVDAVDFIASCQPDADLGLSVRFAIILRDTGNLCGGAGLRFEPAHRRAELGYWIGVPYWGHGYATEAAAAVVQYGFDTLGLQRIYASHFSGNVASARVLQKIGMRHEGRLRSHIFKWEKFYDLECYGMLQSDRSRP